MTLKQEKNLLIEELAMIIRILIVKSRQEKLDAKYLNKVVDYLERKGLQGEVTILE